jgi:hypothetical protein
MGGLLGGTEYTSAAALGASGVNYVNVEGQTKLQE